MDENTPTFLVDPWFNGQVRRKAFLLVLPFVIACNGPSQSSGSSTSNGTQSQDPLESVSFTLDQSSSDTDTGPVLEKLSCEALAQALQKALEDAWPKQTTHGGLSMAVRRADCPPWAGVVGNAQPGQALETDHVMGAGSISKTLMAAAFLTVTDSTKTDVYDPVSKYIPELKDKKINLRNLLNHSMALADYTRESALLDKVKQDPSKAVTPSEIIQTIQGKDTETSPKLEQFLPGQSNAIALDKIMADLSKQETKAIIQTHLFDPMSAKDIYVWGSDPAPAKIAPGWMEKDGQFIQRDQLVPNSYLGAAAGLRATPSGLAHWLEGLTTAKTKLTPTSQAYMMRRTSFASTAAEQYGYGLKIWALKPGVDAYGNDGIAPGYAALAVTVPTQQVTVVIMSNNESQKAALLSAFESSFRAALQPWQPDQGMPRLSLKDAGPFIP